jgi:hypothetical protein
MQMNFKSGVEFGHESMIAVVNLTCVPLVPSAWLDSKRIEYKKVSRRWHLPVNDEKTS